MVECTIPWEHKYAMNGGCQMAAEQCAPKLGFTYEAVIILRRKNKKKYYELTTSRSTFLH